MQPHHPTPVLDHTASIMAQHTRHYYHLAMLSALFAVFVIPIASKMIDIGGTPASVSVLFFPVVYVIGDLLTEVYGYALARRALWYAIIARIIAVFVFGIVAVIPPAATFTHNDAYDFVLGQAPLIAPASIAATFIGDIVNNYIVAKLKIWTKGRYMGLRFVVSTFGSQLTNTAIFYTFGLVLTGVLPLALLLPSVLVGTLTKAVVEMVLLPVSVPLARKLKKIEGIDFYDRGTDFNPLKF